MSDLTVTRKQVVEATRIAIEETRDDGYEVSTALVRKVMKIAREKSEFALGDWRIENCGCLIGWLYGDEFDFDSLGIGESALGLAFDYWLREVIDNGHRLHTDVVKVVG